MKRIFLILICLIVFVTIVYGQEEWISFTSDSTSGIPPVVEVIESNDLRTKIHVTIYGIWVKDTIINDTEYNLLSIPEYTSMQNIEKPLLPAINELIAIPPIANATIDEIDILGTLMLNNYYIYPCQIPETDSGPQNPFVIDDILYSTNAYYPDTIANLSSPLIWRDLRLISLSMYPIIFNPITHQLNITYDFILDISYYGISNVNPILEGYPSSIDSMFDKIYGSSIINYDELGIPVEQSNYYDYLIICPYGYWDQIEDLSFWKHKKGLAVQMVGPIDIVDREYFIEGDTLAIKNYIREFLLVTKKRMAYVLLVGDTDSLPVANGWQCSSWNSDIYSDYWYACVIGDDDLADVAIGRFSVRDTFQARTMVNKVFAYERYPSQEWDIKNALLVSWKRGDYHACKIESISPILNYHKFRYFDCYGGYGYTNNDIKNYIQDNNGISILNYRGHGYNASWPEWNLSGELWDTLDIYNLQNNGFYPIIFEIACSCGRINIDWTCISEAWGRAPNGGGVGSLGATRPSATERNHYFDTQLFRLSFDLGISKIGWLINTAKTKLLEQFGINNWTLNNIRMYHWLGEPELSVWTENHGKLDVDHPEIFDPSNDEFTVIVNSEEGFVQGALVCLYMPNNIFINKYTDANGVAIFSFNPQSNRMFHVTVTKHNYHPYEGTCEIIDDEKSDDSNISNISTDMPEVFKLNQNYPNPFYQATAIYYQIPETGSDLYVSLKIYDITGRSVRTLVNETQSPGYYNVLWNGKDDLERKVLPGIYFYRYSAGNFEAINRTIMLK